MTAKMRRLKVLVSLLLLATGFSGSPPCLADAHHVDFLYIDASEGRASGGHAALRLDDEVFHFQHVDPGLLRISREPFQSFRLAYGFRENRAIRGHGVKLDDQRFQTLRDALMRRLLVQNRQFDQLRALRDDRELLEKMSQTAETLSLKGLGYFVGPMTSPAQSPTLQALRQAAIEHQGRDFFQLKHQQLTTQWQSLKPGPDLLLPTLSETRLPTPLAGFSQRYKAVMTNIQALQILAMAKSPTTDSLVSSDLPEFRLTDYDKPALQRFRQTLFDDALALLKSDRYDWGYPLLIAMARLHAIDLTLTSGRWTVLKRASISTDDPLTLPHDQKPAAVGHARAVLTSAIAKLTTAESWDERLYNDIERIVASLLPLTAAESQTTPIVIATIDSTPSLAVSLSIEPLHLDTEEQQTLAAAIDAAIERYRHALLTLYAYRLLDRNCVTEMFALLNDALPDSGLTITTFDAVPFVAFDRWQAEFEGSDYRLPAYREIMLNQLQQIHHPLAVALTESNVLTASIYRWHDQDAAFLFFTQDTIWPRPLFGAANLAIATAQSLWGLIAWPWHEQPLRQGLKGIAVSLPELFFVNIRKGSFPNLLPWQLPAAEKGFPDVWPEE